MSARPNLDMAADLCERAAAALRRGDTTAFEALTVAHGLRHGGGIPERLYRYGLALLHVATDDIEAAVAAILRGEHPPDSLPGRVAEAQRKAEQARDVHQGNTLGYRHGGAVDALGGVLALLGCEVPK